MTYPKDFKYTKDHEWLEVKGDSATLGITQFAQSELGDVVFVELPKVGREVNQGETICVVESTKAASDVYSPASGVVTEVNTALTDKPELINQDSFGAGWMVKIKGIQQAEVDKLLNVDQYKELVGDQ